MSRILAAGFLLLSICAPAFAQPADGTVISREAVSLPDDAPDRVKATATKVALERIIYVSDGLEVEGYLARPKETDGEKLPCVIFNRGGNGEFGREKYPGERICSECEQHIGGVGREEFGGVLEQMPEADTARMGLFGWSRGGMMTYLAHKNTDLRSVPAS